ncbi:hypothetical protein [Aurantiacibacter aquimixticola]|uniref:Antifreeze protein n=1 Tax=Aurantiacibacter aquimixticola TaxID=1958945 RepID=A0A419RSA4_9SPHN|nr:hypothetical protein [Aurantiacibacter aquimixticola]RJY08656.1 hypothetical protein D6201_04140 [Aurantiacibacter aquimixticola]
MRVGLFLGGAALALTSSLALASGPEDLLPPAFRDTPPQQPTPAPTPTPTATQTARPATPSPGGTPVVQPVPRGPSAPSSGGSSFTLPADFPSLRELERMEADEINAVLGLRPKFDIPAAARRSVSQVGLLSEAEGGFPAGSLAAQPPRLVLAALRASDGPIVSRWGHILMRRVLASRLDAPNGMDPVAFAALRARSLTRMGEGAVARALVQDVDGSSYNRLLTDAAFDSYIATGDILGMCPVARLQTDIREDAEWEMVQAICSAYLGEARSAERRLQRTLGTGSAEAADVRLAQRYAGAAGEGGTGADIDWDAVDELTPWRFALARALGVEIPDELRADAGARYDISEVLIPATPLLQRVQAADSAAARGVLSSDAMVDLYSQLWASDAYEAGDKAQAGLLRDAYVAATVAERLTAIQELWGDESDFGRRVLTAYAAARLPVSEDKADVAAPLIASMLTAGLDRNAMRWADIVSDGSEAWALLALADPSGGQASSGDVDDFRGNDDSADQRRTAFLVAGLAGLGRLDDGDLEDFASDLDVHYTRASAWSNAIGRAAQVDNAALVALLAGLGMQGDSWDRMTPRHLYHIVSALNEVGLSAEARMIAAEAVTRG